MKLTVDYLLPIYLLIPTILIFVGIYIVFKRQIKIKYLMMRIIAIICLLLSLSSMKLIKNAKDTTTIFLADLSNSTLANHDDMNDFIMQAMKYKKASDIVGVLSFGRNSAIENQASKEAGFTGFYNIINGEFTNIQEALVHSQLMIAGESKKRVVLLTDGKENIGDAMIKLNNLSQNGVAIDVHLVNQGSFEEVQLISLDIPEKSERNQLINGTISIQSNVKTQGTVTIYSDNQLKYEKEVSLDIGDNQFVFSDVVTKGGLVSYTAQVIPKDDTYTENNYLSNHTLVNDLPHILVVQDEDEEALNIIDLYENVAYMDVVRPEEVPSTKEELIKYDGVILADISIEKLNDDFVNHLEMVVKNQGKGLLVTGGESSYGPGGYYETPLEELLPVNMEAKPKEEKPNLGLVLVIDKSGSMSSGSYGMSKMELAKEAAIKSTEILDEKDIIGVIGFDSDPKWVVKAQNVNDKEGIQNKIGTMVAGGGTTILPSLEEAVKTLKEMDAGLKHIILLTDGQAENSGYTSVINDMAAHEITLSTVAVGEGADRKLLKYLADYSNGRYYATDVFSDIPSIFTKEAFMAGKKYLNNMTFTPALMNDSPILDGINGLPDLDGYVATSPKEHGKIILTGPDNDPILASWQYGIGRTIAFTSEIKGVWSSNWLAWEQNQILWMNALNYMVQQDINKNYTIDTSYREGQGEITVKHIGKTDQLDSKLSGVIISPEGTEEEIVLDAVAPGEYRGYFMPEGEGVYLANLMIEYNGEKENIVSGVNVGYSLEYDFMGYRGITEGDVEKLENGRMINNPKEVFNGFVPEVSGSRDLSQLLVIIGFIIFMLEVILRKTNIKLTFVRALWERSLEAVNTGFSTVKDSGKNDSSDMNNGSLKPMEKPKNIKVNGLKEKKVVTKQSSKKKIVKRNRKVVENKEKVNKESLNKLLEQKRKRD